MLDTLYSKSNITNNIHCSIPKLSYDAKNTKIINFIKICKDLDILDESNLDIENYKNLSKIIKIKSFIIFLENELTTKTYFTSYGENIELKINGKFNQQIIINCIKKYVNEFLKCSACKNKTEFIKENRLYKIFCKNCDYFKFIKI